VVTWFQSISSWLNTPYQLNILFYAYVFRYSQYWWLLIITPQWQCPSSHCYDITLIVMYVPFCVFFFHCVVLCIVWVNVYNVQVLIVMLQFLLLRSVLCILFHCVVLCIVWVNVYCITATWCQNNCSYHVISNHIISYHIKVLTCRKLRLLFSYKKNTRLSLNQLHVKKEYINFFFCFEILPVLK